MKTILQAFMQPTSDTGKSLRDSILTALVIGLVAGLESIDIQIFGDYSIMAGAVISFIVTRANRLLRKS